MAEDRKRAFGVHSLQKDLVKEGSWYQPYVHSNPQNFNKTVNNNYRDFTVTDTFNKAFKVAEKVFEQIIKFYESRENDFRKKTNLSEKEFKDRIVDVIQEVDDEYKKGERMSVFTHINTVQKVLNSNQKIQNKFLSEKSLRGATNIFLESLFSRADLLAVTESDKKALKKWKKEAKIIATLFEDYLIDVVKEEGGGNPDEIFDEFFQAASLNDSAAMNKAVIKSNKSSKIISKLNKGEAEILELFFSYLDPKLKNKNQLKQLEKNNKSTLSGQLFSIFGSTLNEAASVRLIKGVVNENIEAIVDITRGELTGTKDTKKDISDGLLIFSFNTKGKPFKAGIDIKYTGNAADAGIKYKRTASKQRDVSELEPLFVKKQLNELMYLLVNSYYFKGEVAKYTEMLIGVATIIMGVLALLPSEAKSALDFKRPASIRRNLTTDTRIFVFLNNRLFLMTDFLEAFRDSFLYPSMELGKFNSGRKMHSGSFTGMGKTVFNKSLSQILNGLKKSNDVGKLTKQQPSGSFYERKLAILAGFKKDERKNAYEELKSQVSNPVLGNSLMKLQYKPYLSNFYIKTS